MGFYLVAQQTGSEGDIPPRSRPFTPENWQDVVSVRESLLLSSVS
jgi:hypothetical protein